MIKHVPADCRVAWMGLRRQTCAVSALRIQDGACRKFTAESVALRVQVAMKDVGPEG